MFGHFLFAIVAISAAHVVHAARTFSHVHEVSDTDWDYIVVGGGLGGLVVSKRLAEDEGKNVLIIEAGHDDRDDPKVFNVDNYGQYIGTDLDWNFVTKKQHIAGGKSKTIRGGKTLGGSTSINGAAWNRAHKIQYDHLGNITGDDRYNFKNMQKYMNMAESFVPPTDEQRAAGADYLPEAHGSRGPLSIGFSAIRNKNKKRMFTGPGQGSFLESIQKTLGVAHLQDENSGNNTGAAYTPTSISQDNRRQSACNYFEQSGNNVGVLLGWTVIQLSWKHQDEGRVSGVVIKKNENGKPLTVETNGEVILSAGALNTPGILERSGIGAKDVLQKHNIEQIIDLPGVGKNLQEQTMNTMGGKADLDWSGGGPSNMIANTAVTQLMSNASSVFKYIDRNMDKWAHSLVSQGHVVNADAIQKHWTLSVDATFKKGAPVCEHFFDTGYPADSYGIDTWCLLPFSRGSVHITSKNGFEKPEVDPNYFAIPIDMDMQVAALRANRRVFQTSPLHDLLKRDETVPGFDHIPDDPNHGSYAKWQAWILGTDGTGGFGSVSHPIATCSMIPKEDGGVVDPEFKVYGTNNLRVVDGSVLPIQLSAHLSSSLYGLAELAADVIRH